MARTIAIGDIHGCATALETILDRIQPKPSDSIVGIGDYIDRGMESSRTLEILIDLVTDCHFVPLIGNHELMMFKGLQNENEFKFWVRHGGNATIASYGGRLQNIPQHHITFLGHCKRFYETDSHFFIHANYDPDLPLIQQPDEVVFWQHLGAFLPPMHCSGKIAVVGHTPQVEGRVRNIGHILAIDTFCYGDQWLSAVDVDSGKIWQANNNGDFREDELGEPEEPYYDTYSQQDK